MRSLGLILVALIAALHLFIAYFEIFAWETLGPRIFTSLDEELFTPTVVLAGNQGIYNAFLALGLLWSLFVSDRKWQLNIATCFLFFVWSAGVFGAVTASVTILFVQAVPATIALALLWVGKRSA